MKYQTGAWNYYAIGEYDAETMTNDFNDLGFNLVMSCDYNPYSPYFHDKAAFISHLDSLHAKGMSVVVCDVRTGWGRLKEQGEQEFVRRVKEAVSDFGSHPAVYGFFIGDEPSGAQMSDMVRAYKIVKAAAPALRPFVNFLPIWCTDDYFEKCLGVPATKYGELLDKVVKEAEIDVLCYDYYSQCSYFEADRGEAMYFMNLNVFREVAKKNDIPFFTTLLSVGHWNYRFRPRTISGGKSRPRSPAAWWELCGSISTLANSRAVSEISPSTYSKSVPRFSIYSLGKTAF